MCSNRQMELVIETTTPTTTDLSVKHWWQQTNKQHQSLCFSAQIKHSNTNNKGKKQFLLNCTFHERFQRFGFAISLILSSPETAFNLNEIQPDKVSLPLFYRTADNEGVWEDLYWSKSLLQFWRCRVFPSLTLSALFTDMFFLLPPCHYNWHTRQRGKRGKDKRKNMISSRERQRHRQTCREICLSLSSSL